eukprot:gene10377-8317_t
MADTVQACSIRKRWSIWIACFLALASGACDVTAGNARGIHVHALVQKLIRDPFLIVLPLRYYRSWAVVVEHVQGALGRSPPKSHTPGVKAAAAPNCTVCSTLYRSRGNLYHSDCLVFEDLVFSQLLTESLADSETDSGTDSGTYSGTSVADSGTDYGNSENSFSCMLLLSSPGATLGIIEYFGLTCTLDHMDGVVAESTCFSSTDCELLAEVLGDIAYHVFRQSALASAFTCQSWTETNTYSCATFKNATFAEGFNDILAPWYWDQYEAQTIFSATDLQCTGGPRYPTGDQGQYVYDSFQSTSGCAVESFFGDSQPRARRPDPRVAPGASALITTLLSST